MNIPAEFNEIRPYTPEELPQIYEELIADPAFRTVVESVTVSYTHLTLPTSDLV